MLAEYRYRPPTHLWNECIPLNLVPCPRCGVDGMTKVGAAPDGSHLLMECRDNLCGTVSKVSG